MYPYMYMYIKYIHFRWMLWNDFFETCKAESKNWCRPGRGSTSSAQGSGDHRTTTATCVFTTKCTAGSAGVGQWGGIGHCDFHPVLRCFKRSKFQTQNSLLFSSTQLRRCNFQGCGRWMWFFVSMSICRQVSLSNHVVPVAETKSPL